MSKTFVTSDLHLGHGNILKYDNRPFDNIREHNEAILDRWNDTVSDADEVYYLGDVAFSPQIALQYLSQFKGKIYYIRGNHERPLKRDNVRARFEWVKDYYELDYGGQLFCMSHYPILEWNKGHRGSIHLHGHTHGNLHKKFPWYYEYKVFDMGTNLWDYKPVDLDHICELAAKRENIKHH